MGGGGEFIPRPPTPKLHILSFSLDCTFLTKGTKKQTAGENSFFFFFLFNYSLLLMLLFVVWFVVGFHFEMTFYVYLSLCYLDSIT